MTTSKTKQSVATRRLLSKPIPENYFDKLKIAEYLTGSHCTIKSNVNHKLRWNGPFKNAPNSKTLTALTSDHIIRNDMLNRPLSTEHYFSKIQRVTQLEITEKTILDVNETSVDHITDQMAKELLGIKRKNGLIKFEEKPKVQINESKAS